MSKPKPSNITISKKNLIWRSGYETLVIQPWGKDSLRVRATRGSQVLDHDWCLLPPEPASPKIEIQDSNATLTNGKIRLILSADGGLTFVHALSGRILLAEPPPPLPDNPHVSARQFKSLPGDLFRIEVNFAAQPGERFYGLGQHQHGLLDQKGCVIELSQRNTEVSIPFLLSSMGYGFLWHNPAVGRVELGVNRTRWVAKAARQVDFWITCGDTLAEILEHYADASGHSPALPAWAAGFWQCKLRYASQQELLDVAREFQQRGLPLDVIVIDGGHWTMMGDWQFDPDRWPDPAGMVQELEAMGVKTMVSVWPTVNANSPSFEALLKKGCLVRTERGVAATSLMIDTKPSGPVYLHLYDAMHPGARQFIWEKIRQGYYQHGVKMFWLDANEPEFYPTDYDHLRFYLGSGMEVGNLYPQLHQKAFYDGLRSEGEQEIITLGRSAWAGSQRYGAAVWSGDIPSTFEALRAQLPAGLNIGLSGIPWWTTDIGGFHGGDPCTPYFQELIVRWFQYGVFCPIFRLHGYRSPGALWTGAPNEPWSFGERAYAIIRELLFLRQRMKPYILEQMQAASLKGIPPMRPLFFDFPHDPACAAIEDQFMFGPDLLVAPVLYEGQRERMVYLPAGTDWTDAYTGEQHSGGTWTHTPAPLERLPLFIRAGRKLPILPE
ncbi:MAG: glycoside hydrolase family 31 protein [Anaerolineales bacterium]|nr:glycoside hydrolase family 31 protein [Anaerolineales bacterium]